MFRSILPAVLLGLAAACSSTASNGENHGSAADRGAAVAGTVHATDAAAHQRAGFIVELDDGRLWVMREGQKKEEKCVTWIGAAPGGLTLRAPDAETALAYVASKPGFVVEVDDGRLWVMREGQKKEEKCVTRIGAGPRGVTVRAPDAETLNAYLAAR